MSRERICIGLSDDKPHTEPSVSIILSGVSYDCYRLSRLFSRVAVERG